MNVKQFNKEKGIGLQSFIQLSSLLSICLSKILSAHHSHHHHEHHAH